MPSPVVSPFRDFVGWLHELDHRLHIEDLCIGDSVKARISKIHNEPFGTVGLYIRLYASIVVSFLHNVG